MSASKVNLDRQAEGRLFSLGTTAASGEALLTLNKGTQTASQVVLDVKGSASIAGDLNLVGNLNITGNVDSQTVTNTNVKDITITVNDGGTTAGAAGAGLKVEGDTNTVIGAITYAAASGSKFQIGNGTTQVDIADVSSTQTLTNKSISGGQITSAVANATLAASVTTNANLTGDITSSGNATSYNNAVPVAKGGTGATANTGTGNNVLATSPTLVTPVLGVATATSVNKVALTAPATAATITLADNSTLSTVGAFVTTLTATAATSVTLPTAGTLATLAGTETLTNKSITGSQITSAVANATLAATASVSNAIKSATTSVDTASATAPTTGQVLTATGGSAATWQTPTTGKTFTRTAITGTINGSNTAFTLGVTPNPAGSEQVIQNGIVLLPGSGNDYTITGAAVTFAVAPVSGDQLQAFASS